MTKSILEWFDTTLHGINELFPTDRPLIEIILSQGVFDELYYELWINRRWLNLRGENQFTCKGVKISKEIAGE